MDPFKTIILALIIFSCNASAEFIQLTPSVTVPTLTRGDSANMTFSILNTGDEVAKDIRVELELPEGLESGVILVGDVQPEQKVERTITLSVDENLEGSYPAILMIKYTDVNGYGFTALSHAVMHFKQQAYPQIAVKSKPSTIPEDGGGELLVEIVNNEGGDVDATIKLYLPNELTVDEFQKKVSLPSKKKQSISFYVENFLGIAGSIYPGTMTIEYEISGVHHTHISSSDINIVSGKKSLYYVGAAVAVIIIVFFIRKRYSL